MYSYFWSLTQQVRHVRWFYPKEQPKTIRLFSNKYINSHKSMTTYSDFYWELGISVHKNKLHFKNVYDFYYNLNLQSLLKLNLFALVQFNKTLNNVRNYLILCHLCVSVGFCCLLCLIDVSIYVIISFNDVLHIPFSLF